MVLISLHWDLKSETCQRIPVYKFHCGFPLSFIWCVVFNQWCCVFIQYNLLKSYCKWILIHPWNQVIDYSLPGLTWHIRFRIGTSNLPISEIYGGCYISYCFYFSVMLYFSFIFYDCLLLINAFCFCFHVFWQ